MNYQEDIDQFLNKFNFSSDLPIDSGKIKIHQEIGKRLDMLKEELKETEDAVLFANKEELIDGLVDLVYIAIGTARLCGYDFNIHWSEVHRANMTKERGRSKRGHDFDVYKPESWIAPNHKQFFKLDGSGE